MQKHVLVSALTALSVGAAFSACSTDRNKTSDAKSSAAQQGGSSDVTGTTVPASGGEDKATGAAGDTGQKPDGDGTTLDAKKVPATGYKRDAEVDPDKDGVDACTLLELIPYNCVLNQNIKCAFPGVTTGTGCAEPVARQALYSAACAAGVPIVEDEVVCSGGKLGTGADTCGQIPTDRGLTAEQTLCCINGEWQARLGEKFGGPGCSAD